METPHVYTAIAAVSAELSRIGIPKDRDNKAQGFKFRGIDDIIYYLSPLLPANGLIIIPRHVSRSVEERSTKNGGLMFFATVHAEFDFVSSMDGSKHTASMFGEGADTGDKATAKAASVAYKNVCIQVFCIPVEGTPDADDDNPPETTPKKQQPPVERKVSEIHEFSGEWRDCHIHVGKDIRGKTLGEIKPNQLDYLMANFNPKKGPDGYAFEDANLRSALNAAAQELHS